MAKAPAVFSPQAMAKGGKTYLKRKADQLARLDKKTMRHSTGPRESAVAKASKNPTSAAFHKAINRRAAPRAAFASAAAKGQALGLVKSKGYTKSGESKGFSVSRQARQPAGSPRGGQFKGK